MQMDIAWKSANLTLIGPFAIALAGLNVSAESRGVARSASTGLVHRNIRDPLNPAVDTKLPDLDVRQ
jgi:hypothetical protein